MQYFSVQNQYNQTLTDPALKLKIFFKVSSYLHKTKIVVTIVGGLEITKWAHFSLKGILTKHEVLQMVTLLL